MKYKIGDMVVDNTYKFPQNINLILNEEFDGYYVKYLSFFKVKYLYLEKEYIKEKYNNQLFRYLYF